MRKLIVALLLLLTTCFSLASIVGSKHDFSADAWSGGRICITCHTPHNAMTSVANAPLWNHTVTTATFTLYSSGTMDATDLGQPDGSSKLCLSCHDGTVALDSYGTNTPIPTFITGNALVGTDISNDHPISFTYDAALATADGRLYDPTTQATSLGGTIDNDLLDGDSKLQCSSCHDVHNRYPSNPKLLKIHRAQSELCLTCHNM